MARSAGVFMGRLFTLVVGGKLNVPMPFTTCEEVLLNGLVIGGFIKVKLDL